MIERLESLRIIAAALEQSGYDEAACCAIFSTMQMAEDIIELIDAE